MSDYRYRIYWEVRCNYVLCNPGFTILGFFKKVNPCTIDIVLLEIQPGAEKDFVQTEAFELKFLISGRVKYQFRDQTIDLNEVDSMLFDGRIEHNPINLGELPAKMLVVYFFEVG